MTIAHQPRIFPTLRNTMRSSAPSWCGMAPAIVVTLLAAAAAATFATPIGHLVTVSTHQHPVPASGSNANSTYANWTEPWTAPWLHDWTEFLRHEASKWEHWGVNDTCSHPVPPFPCASLENQEDDDGIAYKARTADQVRHRDVRIVAVLGDSISAGFGMISDKLPSARVLEYRGKVFSIGGDKHELTLPNLLARVVSTGGGKHHRKPLGAPKLVTVPLALGKDLDRAVSGAIVQDLSKQATGLLSLLALPPYLPHYRDWKLVTVLIGANNLCRVCFDAHAVNPVVIKAQLRNVLLRLRRAAPRWIVNLMGLFKVAQVFDAAQPVPYCKTVFERFHFCPCVGDAASRERMDQLADAYNAAFADLAHEFEGDKHFKVIYQPGFTGTDIVQYGQEFLSKLDCFHPNLCANQVMAHVLWNNMLEPEGAKTTVFDPYNLTWACPSRDSMYIS
ncbi:hypothetical protein AMAG_17058 [Allomyces macrogynus ATCC 38327]|uniref:Uncharacterized protein n=1 Tax=Allomyces macrogynus (strain ATCC 38327) TaxID=578462 RepID=A0A0L0TCS5_ALLM3|nr:hypothetical protein AMAG_17058 [Allomyces macrogynus ATCC 38327]|eukprot:KNE72723.1 hypothetical protein AMAG_17058 [Allomyces macrogynus ATCC 38327]